MTGAGDGSGALIRIGGQGQGPDGAFRVQVSFEGAGEYQVTVADPAEPQDEELLAWYFEEHLRYPFLDKDLEAGAVARIAAYRGEAVRPGARRAGALRLPAAAGPRV
jgi:hypothetical protein